jgi:hypothetical protein
MLFGRSAMLIFGACGNFAAHVAQHTGILYTLHLLFNSTLGPAKQARFRSPGVLCVRDLYLCLALCHSTCARPAPVHRLSACEYVVRKLCGNNFKNIFPSVACFIKKNKNIKDLNVLVQTQENTLLVYELNLAVKCIFLQIIMSTLLTCISLCRLYYTI